MIWFPDSQLDNFQACTLQLPGAARYGREAVEPVATLIRRTGQPRRDAAVLYLHGWSDYFFQEHLAQRVEGMGYDFYAVDLRRYGRSLREGQLAGYVTDLAEYFVELDAAVGVIEAEGHQRIVVMGHSTGGLICALWADRRPGQLAGMVLNSPWLDVRQPPALVPVMSWALRAASALAPTEVLPLAENQLYHRSISAEHEGLWHYNSDWKSNPAFLVRTAWLRAILAGQNLVATGLSIDVPILVATSIRSDFRPAWDDALLRADIVLDVDRIARRATKLGTHVTLLRIDDALHDIALSPVPVRERFFEETERWLTTYCTGA